MPDILIRGMELPAKPTAITIMPNGDIYDFFIDTKYGTAVELPEHGNLISRDAALSHPFANGRYDHENANEHFIFLPVFVPASEEGDRDEP